MRVERGLSTDKDHPLTSPFPCASGVFFEFRAGDICHPLGSGNWMSPPFFTHIFRAYMPLHMVYALHLATALLLLYAIGNGMEVLSVASVIGFLICPGKFFSYRVGNKGGYIGFKAFGADLSCYKEWMPKEDVFPGSTALHVSIRPLATLG